jgi:glycosyltransferase involved in cell wall biosynthesis
VLPSWFPPNGGSFFLEQSTVLNEIAEEIVLYVEPISIKMLIKSPFKIKKLFLIQEEIVDGLKIIRGFNLRVPKLFLPNLYIEKFAYLKLYKYALKKYGKPDLIHVHSSIWGGWYAYWIKEIYNIPYIITEHRSRFVNNKYAKSFNQLPTTFDKYLNKIFSKATFILPVSDAMVDKIKTYSNNKNIFSIPNLVNEKLFYYDRKIQKNKKFTFISVAGLIPLKGIDILINAFKKLIDKNIDAKLIIIGDGSDTDKLKKLSTKLKLNDKVDFLGMKSREEVAKYMKSSHVFILPTKYEAFGVVFIEALSCGLPVVSTKNSGGPDSIVNKKNGLLVEIDNVEELANAMEYMYKNYSKYNNFKIAKEAKQKYGKESFKKVYEEVYKKVVNEG